MDHILEITAEHINKLDDIQLTDLLIRLLRMEAQKYGIPTSSISGSLEIKAPDGGDDAHIKWRDGPEKTNWICNRNTLFQCKAEDIRPANVKMKFWLRVNIILNPVLKMYLITVVATLFFSHKNATKK